MTWFRPSDRPLRVAIVEALSARELLATAPLRIVTYNVEADVNGNTAPNAGLTSVLQAIGAYKINGNARAIDVLALQETTSNAVTVKPIVDALNGIYGAGTYAMSALQLGESNNSPGTGNGPSALIYNVKTVSLLESYGVPGALGATTGVYRQVGRYELRPLAGTTASDFYLYVSHYKSGTGDANASKRAGEAGVIRQDVATLGASARVIYAGDFNTSANGEGIFTTLMGSGVGQAFDPRLPNGGVGNVESSLASLTESSTSLYYRDDYQMVTSNVLNDAAGLKIIAGTLQSFGNNGSVPIGGRVDAASNTALASLSNGAAVLSALTTASDHLPAIADYTDVIPDPPTTNGALAGTVIGTAGSFGNSGNTIAKAFDGSLSTYVDLSVANGGWAGLDLGAATAIGTIQFSPRPGWAQRMVGGVFQGSDTASFSSGVVTLATIGSAPAVGVYTSLTSGSAQAFRYVRYLSPNGGYGNVAEVKFFARSGTPPTPTVTKLGGTTIGTSGSFNNSGNTIAKAVDGDLATYFDAAAANGDYVGLDLGTAKTIKQIAYAPRAGWAGRMVGGIFQGSNSADFGNATTLLTITATPAQGALTTATIGNAAAFRYVRYLSPNGGWGNVAEMQFFG